MYVCICLRRRHIASSPAPAAADRGSGVQWRWRAVVCGGGGASSPAPAAADLGGGVRWRWRAVVGGGPSLSLCEACGGGGVVARRRRHGGAAACVRRRRAVGAAAPPALFLFQNTPSPRANMASRRTFTERGARGSRRRVLRRYSVRREAFTESKLSVKASVRGKGPSARGIPLSAKTSNPVVLVTLVQIL
jgi:hypothetical protein